MKKKNVMKCMAALLSAASILTYAAPAASAGVIAEDPEEESGDAVTGDDTSGDGTAEESVEGGVVADPPEEDPIEGEVETESGADAEGEDAAGGQAEGAAGPDAESGEAAPAEGVNADDNVVVQEDDKPYLALGEDLSAEQRDTVLDLMGVDPDGLDDINVVYISNAEEHQYLDEYVPKEQIGTRSLSSVVIVRREKGNGLNISTKNINYCTVGMYKNALATAGLQDADVIVAAPTPISGTAALIGAMKAYSQMTGEPVDDKCLDAAMNEIVVTGELSNIIEGADDGEVEQFIAYCKQKVLEGGLKDEESIRGCIDEALEKYDFSMTDDEKNTLVNLLIKISKLDIDVDALLDQVKSVYDEITQSEESKGFFARLFQSIIDFFKNLFNW